LRCTTAINTSDTIRTPTSTGTRLYKEHDALYCGASGRLVDLVFCMESKSISSLSDRPMGGATVLKVGVQFRERGEREKFLRTSSFCIPGGSSLSSFYLANNITVCRSTSIQFRRRGQQGPTRTLTAASITRVNIETERCTVSIL